MFMRSSIRFAAGRRPRMKPNFFNLPASYRHPGAAFRPATRRPASGSRPFSMQAAVAPAAHGISGQASVSASGSLAPFVKELDRMAPCFDVDGSQIRVLQTPGEFYETLKVC